MKAELAGENEAQQNFVGDSGFKVQQWLLVEVVHH
jgi:hypothetical protein